MILDRFDAVIFIGDDTLKAVYAAFNMLLRENLAMGGLKQWELIEMDDAACRCDNQLIRPECMTYAVTDSQEIAENDEKSVHKSPYYCARKCTIPHSQHICIIDFYRHATYVPPHHGFSSS